MGNWKKAALFAVLLLAEAALLALGHWQWRRYQQRMAEQAEAAARPPEVMQGLYLPGVMAALTNQPNPQNPEESGWRMLGVLNVSGSLVVVDRGYAPPRWVRDDQPDFRALQPPMGPQTLYGVYVPLPLRKGWLHGPDITTHPQLLAFLNPALLVSGTLAPQQFVLTAADTSASVPVPSAPPLANPLRHLSYMIQWWVMAAVLPLLAWGAALSRRRGRRAA